ncbi:MAG: purine-binding chemotaxis protein CheW [Chloroflexi bacterium]|nr:purine-binding chemotaxis protein CheW [Chloroflexota bacterium]
MDTTSSPLALDSNAKSHASLQLLTFCLQEQEYALAVANVVQVARMVAVTRAPKAPAYVQGLMNLHGQVIPVINLTRLFGLPEQTIDLDTQLLIAMHKGRTAAFIVDVVSQVLVLTPEQVERHEDIVHALAYLCGVGMVGERLLLILDLDALFNDIVFADGELHQRQEVFA